MKLLLDENLPLKVKADLSSHNVFTVHDCGWNGKKNGELLELMMENKFDALITADKNLQSQQNFKVYPIPIIVLNVKRLTYHHIQPLLPKLKKLLNKELKVGTQIISD